MRNSTTYFTHGAYTSFVNREVAKWLKLQQHGGTVAGVHHTRSSRHDVPTSEVVRNYVVVIFDLTFFNEVTKSDNILKSIEANVIDSCIEVIIGLPDIRSHRMVHHTLIVQTVPPQGNSQASPLPTITLVVCRDTLTTSKIWRKPRSN